MKKIIVVLLAAFIFATSSAAYNSEYSYKKSIELPTVPISDDDNNGGDNETLRGDANNDGKLNNKDVVFLFRLLSSASGTTEYSAAYDFNEDGKINNKDVVSLFRYLSTTV